MNIVNELKQVIFPIETQQQSFIIKISEVISYFNLSGVFKSISTVVRGTTLKIT